MEIDELVEIINLKDRKIINSAKEFMRIVRVRIPMGLGACEVCKNCACIMLAYQKHNVNLEKDDLNKMISANGSNIKLFNAALKRLQDILGIKRHLSIKDIATEFNLLQLVEQTENLIQVYKQKLLAGISEIQQKYVDFDNSEYTSAALFVMVEQHSLKIDTIKLLDFSRADQGEFARIVASIKDTCYEKKPLTSVSLVDPLKKLALPKRPRSLIINKNNNNNQNNQNNNLSTQTNTQSQQQPISTQLNDNSQILPDKNNNNLIDLTDDGKDDNQQQTQEEKEVKKEEIKKEEIKDNCGDEKNHKSLNDDVKQLPIINHNGSISLMEERQALKRIRDQKYEDWKETVLNQNNNQRSSVQTTATKQSTLDSFFVKK